MSKNSIKVFAVVIPVSYAALAVEKRLECVASPANIRVLPLTGAASAVPLIVSSDPIAR